MVRKTMTGMKAAILIAAVTVGLVQLTGCGGSGDSAAKTGTLKLAITDKQSDDFAKVVISVREVRVVPVGRENADDNDPGLPVVVRYATPKVIDVMTLQFVQLALGEVILPVGNYSQVRLILEPNQKDQPPANYLEMLNGDIIPLKTPSGQQKVLGPLEVKPGINAYMLDFDPNTAIVSRGNGAYNMKPTGIRVVRLAGDLTDFGSISGIVLSTFKDWSSASISVKRRGTINDTEPIAYGKIFSSYTSGAWQAPFAAFVPPTPASQLILYKTFIAANGFRTYSSAALDVMAHQSTDLGPITLVTTP